MVKFLLLFLSLEKRLGEVAQSGPSTAYTWGADGLAVERYILANESYYYFFGPQGETRYAKDGSGTTVGTYVYTAYGVPVATTGNIYNPHRYGGKYGYFFDSPFKALLTLNRWYNPEIRRWINRDPIEYRGGDNMDMYVHDNPVKYVDPSGLNAYEEYSTLDGAGADALNEILPDTQVHGTEYGGSICLTSYCYYYTAPVTTGEPDHVTFPGCRNGDTRVGTYHSHTRYVKPQFSPFDMERANGDNADNKPWTSFLVDQNGNRSIYEGGQEKLGPRPFGVVPQLPQPSAK